MSDQRIGRHVRIYEWDEVDIEEKPVEEDLQATKAQPVEKKAAPEQPRGLGALLKKKLF